MVMWDAAAEEEGDSGEDKDVDDFDHRGLEEMGFRELNIEAKTWLEYPLNSISSSQTSS